MADSGIRALNLWLPNRGDIPHVCNIQDTNASAVRKSARHRQSQETKKTPTTELTFFLPKIFPTENNNEDRFEVSLLIYENCSYCTCNTLNFFNSTSTEILDFQNEDLLIHMHEDKILKFAHFKYSLSNKLHKCLISKQIIDCRTFR